MDMNSKAVFEKLVSMNDKQVQIWLGQQVNEPGSRHDGGIVVGPYGVPTASHGGTAGCIGAMAASFVTPQSAYHYDPQLLSALDRAMDFMLRRQHEDGTISLGGTNFHSPPDTGFVVNGMVQIYRVLASCDQEGAAAVAAKVKRFLARALPAMLTGGCHTPNHRWVIVAALASLHGIFGDERLIRRADEWLAEGLDNTLDGEWTERSNGIYNTVSNIMMIYAADALGRPELLEPVRRNLEMMAYMIHEDGEVITDYSGRQDLGLRHDLSEYFLCYRLMAARDRNPLFAAMYDLAAATMTRLGPVNNHALLGWLSLPCGDVDAIDRAPLPDRFRRVFNAGYPIARNLAKMAEVGHHGQIKHSSMHTAFGSPVMRWREGRLNATAMTRSPSLFSLRYGDVRLAGISLLTLFTPGVVLMEDFEETAAGCRMGTTMEKGYYGPIAAEHLPPSAREAVSPWYLLPHHLRPYTHAQRHRLEAEVARDGAEWVLRLKSDERPDVLTQAVLIFAQDAVLAGEALEASGEGPLLWKGGKLVCTSASGAYGLELAGGRFDHGMVQGRGLPSFGAVQAVLVNLLTPFDQEIRIRLIGPGND